MKDSSTKFWKGERNKGKYQLEEQIYMVRKRNFVVLKHGLWKKGNISQRNKSSILLFNWIFRKISFRGTHRKKIFQTCPQ